MTEVKLTLNGKVITDQVEPDLLLIDFLRDHGCYSVKRGCETANCGLCTVLMDGRPILSCSMLTLRAAGHSIQTLEGLQEEAADFVGFIADQGADQCGFCNPGFVMNTLPCCGRILTPPTTRSAAFWRAISAAAPATRDSCGASAAIWTAETGRRAAPMANNRPTDYKAIFKRCARRTQCSCFWASRSTLMISPRRMRWWSRFCAPPTPTRWSGRSTTAIAAKVPGVVAIYTWQDVPQNRFTIAGQTYPEPSPYDRLILDRHVRFAGDAVAIIAAETEKAALKAMKLIKVQYDVLPAVLDYRTAKDNETLVHPEEDWYPPCPVGGDNHRNLVASDANSDGDVEAVLADCDIVLDRTYHTKAYNQAMMETFRTYAEKDRYGRLHIISSTQIVFHCRRIISRALGIPMSKVRVEKPRIGGGFGAKQTAVCEMYPAFVTWMTGRPSKLIYTVRNPKLQVPRATRWKSGCGWAPTSKATSAPSTCIPCPIPAPTVSMVPPRWDFPATSRFPCTPAIWRPTASAMTWSTPTTRRPAPTVATVPPRASTRWKPPSTSCRAAEHRPHRHP